MPGWRRSGFWGRLVEIDFKVVEVILRVLADKDQVLVINLAAKLGGNSGPESTRRDDGLLGDNGAGGDDAAFADMGVVEHSGAHADYDVVCDDAAVDGGVVADGNPVTDDDGIDVSLTVEDGTVLDV